MTEQRYRRSPTALSREVDGEILLARPDRNDFDVLPDTAAGVWNLLVRPQTALGLAAELADHYEEPIDRIATDVSALLEELVRRGWVERAGDG
jgi:hypothetical protein